MSFAIIEEAYKKFSHEPKFKELKEMLPENISYEEIRCVTAHFNMSKIAKYILK